VRFLVQSPSTFLAVVIVLAVVAMVAWALQLMQTAADRKEFSLMLAGCMVCSAAVGLATVMVMTFTSADRLHAQGYLSAGSSSDPEGYTAGVSLDAISLPWDASPDPTR
jgi:ABC-type glycerol-3-phosphate transport system permease component